jgi:RimJ/RimL family protein N-acetyltransferase
MSLVKEAPACLSTSRLRLVRFGKEHLTERYVNWLNDPEVVRFSEQRHRSHDLRSSAEWVARFTGASLVWAITYRGEHIGNIAATCDVPNLVADLSIMIGERAAWGLGLGGEAWDAAMTDLLARGVRRVEAGTMAVNTGMLAIFRKAGMVEEGRRKGHFLLNGRPVDMVLAAREAAA